MAATYLFERADDSDGSREVHEMAVDCEKEKLVQGAQATVPHLSGACP
jgi:hypothetical protein